MDELNQTGFAGDPSFDPGGIKDRVDLRDFQFDEVGFATPLFDWDLGYDIEKELGVILPVKDQNGSGSCGGQAWATMAAVLEAKATGTHEERSAKFIYAQTYVPSGGSYGRDNANIFAVQGVARETHTISYANGLPPSEEFMRRGQDITQEARINAKLARAYPYSQVGNDIDEIARAIRDTGGVILGVSGANNGTWGSEFPKPPMAVQWRHWVYAGKVKRMNGIKYIGILNSWGKQTGIDGWQWLAEDYFKHLASGETCVWSVWSHTFNPESIPVTFRHTFNVDLEYGGQRGKEVEALQIALQIEGLFPSSVSATGYFGLLTRTAVEKFQVKYNISAPGSAGFGRCGPKTRLKLNSIFSL